MERRSFLAGLTGLSAMPLSTNAWAESAHSSDDVKLVPAGQDLEGVTRTMPFSQVSFKISAGQTGNALLLIEHSFSKKGGPPRHMHPHQDEWFYLLEGGPLVMEVGDRKLTLKPGDSLFAPRGHAHVWAYMGDGPGRMLMAFTPAGKMEDFFHKATGSGLPGPTKQIFEEHDIVYLGPPLAT